MPYDFEVSDQMPVPPEIVFDAWMSSVGHSAMTGATATVDPRVGGAFDAWNGYINGETVALDAPVRIVQTWRTSNFTDADPDSRIEVVLSRNDEGTLVTIRHSSVPDEHLGYENGGWNQSYFTPMKAYFASM
jgi:uncharacterized protein YndB with AHSA1/START domain